MLEVQKYYPQADVKGAKFKDILAHLIKLFRFANKTNVQVGEELTMKQFFYGDKGDTHPLLSYTSKEQNKDNSGFDATKEASVDPKSDTPKDDTTKHEDTKDKQKVEDDKSRKRHIFTDPESAEQQEKYMLDKFEKQQSSGTEEKSSQSKFQIP